MVEVKTLNGVQILWSGSVTVFIIHRHSLEPQFIVYLSDTVQIIE